MIYRKAIFRKLISFVKAGHVIRKRCIQFTREFIADHAFIIALIATSNEDPSVAFLGCLKSYQPNKLHDEL